MTELATQKCVACNADSPRVSTLEARTFLEEIPEWHIRQYAGVDQLERSFTFKDFVSALAFANRVGELAEQEGHHPALLIEWGKVKVSWWTHAISGLHRNDFIMAAKTDQRYDN